MQGFNLDQPLTQALNSPLEEELAVTIALSRGDWVVVRVYQTSNEWEVFSGVKAKLFAQCPTAEEAKLIYERLIQKPPCLGKFYMVIAPPACPF